MGDVYFYHQTRSTLEQTLPEILGKCRGRGWPVVVQAADRERLNRLDRQLWTQSVDDFLPHGVAGQKYDADQPVLLSTHTDAPNRAKVLVVLDDLEIDPETAARFTRVCLIFDGNAGTSLTAARQQWARLAKAGVPARYWSQESGSWQDKTPTVPA